MEKRPFKTYNIFHMLISNFSQCLNHPKPSQLVPKFVQSINHICMYAFRMALICVKHSNIMWHGPCKWWFIKANPPQKGPIFTGSWPFVMVPRSMQSVDLQCCCSQWCCLQWCPSPGQELYPDPKTRLQNILIPTTNSNDDSSCGDARCEMPEDGPHIS